MLGAQARALESSDITVSPGAVLPSNGPFAEPAGAVVSGVAPVWVGERVAGDPRPGTVLHAGADALYVRDREDVIGVTSRHAIPVPCAISTRAGVIAELFGARRTPRPGDPVTVGGGMIDFGGVMVRVGRLADYAMPRIDPAAAELMRARLADCQTLAERTGTPSQTTEAVSEELGAAARALLRSRPDLALDWVLGRGSGLTPVGDDVLCGVLATLISAGDPCAPRLRRRIRQLAPARTTSLSATLLRRAGEGDALPAFADVVRALLSGSERAPAHVDRLRRVGHTSGAGMLLGLQLALDHLTARSCRP